jgi:phosphocarrier protein HPr
MIERTQISPILCAPNMERELIILNKLGLHARPAAEFVRCARRFKSTIVIKKDGEKYSAASILDVLSANLDCGSKMTVCAEGADAEKALEELAALMEQFQKQED